MDIKLNIMKNRSGNYINYWFLVEGDDVCIISGDCKTKKDLFEIISKKLNIGKSFLDNLKMDFRKDCFVKEFVI